jgi:hypothetical protein
MQSGTIQSSIFSALDIAGLPDSVAEALSDIFGDAIDFHADLRRGDRFNVIYEVFYHQGRAIRTGRILAAEFINRGFATRPICSAEPTATKTITARTAEATRPASCAPLEFSGSAPASRCASTRYWASGANTRAWITPPLMAPPSRPHPTASSNSSASRTATATSSSCATGEIHHRLRPPERLCRRLKPGNKVRQGEIIGFVGSTGWSTGPHLHYEFRINDVHQDPLTVSLPAQRR